MVFIGYPSGFFLFLRISNNHPLRFPPFSRIILAFRFASACATATLNSVLVCSVEIKRKLPYLHRPGNSPIPSPLGIKSNKFTNIPSVFILPLRWECAAIHFFQDGLSGRWCPRPSQVQWWPGNNPHRFAEWNIASLTRCTWWSHFNPYRLTRSCDVWDLCFCSCFQWDFIPPHFLLQQGLGWVERLLFWNRNSVPHTGHFSNSISFTLWSFCLL